MQTQAGLSIGDCSGEEVWSNLEQRFHRTTGGSDENPTGQQHDADAETVQTQSKGGVGTTRSSKVAGNGTLMPYDDSYHVIASVDGGLYTEW